MPRLPPICLLVSAALLAACSAPAIRAPAVDPDAARAAIASRLPDTVQNREGWAVDIFAAFEALDLAPSAEHTCAVVALVAQESTFRVDPAVPGLPAIARREIAARARSHGIPMLVVNAGLALRSSDGRSYDERIDAAKTEKDLSNIFQDFIARVPLGERLFANWNPVRTGGPMQVSIAFAEAHARDRRYPYPMSGSVRDEVFTRRGGLYFGIAHLLDYPAGYDDMLYRFADYNAGHFASRNAAFQAAVTLLGTVRLVADGDLVLHGDRADEPSRTELAVRRLSGRLEMTSERIRADLRTSEGGSFAATRLYARVFELADARAGKPVARARVPDIELTGPKITRKLTTDWFARRVDERHERCLARAPR